MTSAHRYLSGIAGLRAIAVLAVVAYHIHAPWLPGGFVGVDVFFVISGFVVALSVSSLPPTRFQDYVSAFYKRRFRRILPASYAYIAAATLIGLLVIPLVQETRLFEPTGAAATVGLSNFMLFKSQGDYFSESSELNPFTHTWSLAVEEQYYFIFPFLSYFIFIKNDRNLRKISIAFLLALAIISLAVAIYTSLKAPIFAFYLLPSRFWELALGFGLQLLLTSSYLPGLALGWRRAADPLAILALSALGLALVSTDPHHFPFPGALVPCLATAALIAVIWLFPGCLVDRVLSQPLPTWFGNVSYSMYLWHWGVIVAMRWTCGLETLPKQICAIVMIVMLSWLSHRFVERPFNRRDDVRTVPARRVFAGYGALAATLAVVSLATHYAKPEIGPPAANRQMVWDPYLAPPQPAGCRAGKTITPVGAGMRLDFDAPCLSAAAPRLFIIGDSHAGAYQRAAWQIAASGAFRTEILTLGGCRVISAIDTPPIEGCQAFLDQAQARVAREGHSGDVVLLAGLQTARYVAGAATDRARPLSPVAIAASRKRLTALAALGPAIIVEAAKPVVPVPQYMCADWYTRGNPVCRLPPNAGPDDVFRRMTEANFGIAQVVSGIPGIIMWDPAKVLCNGRHCEGYRDGKPLYFDQDHLSAYGNDILRPDLLAVAKRASQASGAGAR